MSSIVHTTDGGFDQDVIQADKPVLVDYWAEWCGPCKMIAPILDEIASEYADRIKVCKVDIDANQDTPRKYGNSRNSYTDAIQKRRNRRYKSWGSV